MIYPSGHTDSYTVTKSINSTFADLIISRFGFAGDQGSLKDKFIRFYHIHHQHAGARCSLPTEEQI